VSDTYEYRAAAFPFLSAPGVYCHGRVDLRQWHAYSTELDGELREHEDRANREDCWRDWWRASWIRPELCGGCREWPCLQTEDCPGGRHYERIRLIHGEEEARRLCW
jgi:hypothetical protein